MSEEVFKALMIANMARFFDVLVEHTKGATQKARHILIERVLRAAWQTRHSLQPDAPVMEWLTGLIEAASEGELPPTVKPRRRCMCYLTVRYECQWKAMPRVADMPRGYQEW